MLENICSGRTIQLSLTHPFQKGCKSYDPAYQVPSMHQATGSRVELVMKITSSYKVKGEVT